MYLLRKTIKKLLGKIKIFFGILYLRINYPELIKSFEINPVIISLPTIDWNLKLFQRPQHLAKQISKNIFYIYGTSNFTNNEVNGIKQITKSLYLTNIWYSFIRIFSNKFVFLLSTQQYTTIDDIKYYLKQGHKIIYDYVDEIHEEISGSKKMADFLQERHNYIKESKIADLVLCVSNKLYQEMIAVYPKEKVLLVPNGVEYDHFQIKRNIKKIPSDLKKIIDYKKPIIGYYGALAKWIDYNLINETAQKHPEWNFVLIGVDYDKSLSMLKKLNNIFFLGPKTYQELPKYGIWFDVAMIPFVKGEIAKATSPLKFYEYMAMGKPTIITEDLEDCKNYEKVFISKNNSADFSKQITAALKIKDNPKYIRTFKKIAKNNTWEQRAKLIIDNLNG